MQQWLVKLDLHHQDDSLVADNEWQRINMALGCEFIDTAGIEIPRDFSCSLVIDADDEQSAEKRAMERTTQILVSSFPGWQVRNAVCLGPSGEPRMGPR